MAKLPIDWASVDECRALAEQVASDVQRFVDVHSTVGVERAVARAYGVEGATEDGTPLCNKLVERLRDTQVLNRGVAYFLGRELCKGASSVKEAAGRILEVDWNPEPQSGLIDLAMLQGQVHSNRSLKLDTNLVEPTLDQIRGALEMPTLAVLANLDAARSEREGRREKHGMSGAPLRYVIVATGNIHDDALQAKSAALGGADIVAVIRATAQSLLDYVPEGATTEGFGGTYATQENFRIVRRALDEYAEEHKRYVMQCNYSSGLCMSEIAYMAAIERLDMLLNDCLYGILFRDINMRRTFIDQYFSRRLIARAGIVINTGEDNYLTTADAVESAHTVLASQFINEALAHKAGIKDEYIGLGHAFEINPWLENSFLTEFAQAQLVRQVFPKHPIKWMPPTKFKTGDVFHSHVHDAMFNMVGALTHQSIVLLGMFSEAIHNPLLMDRYLSLKSAKYIFGAAKDLGDDIEFRADGKAVARAKHVLQRGNELLKEVASEGIWGSLAKGVFADVKRAATGGKGLEGVFERGKDYVNPLLEALEVRR